MNKGLIVKIIVPISILMLLLILILSLIDFKNNDKNNKISITDFGQVYQVDNVVSLKYKTNFDLTIKAGEYHKDDSVFVFYQGSTIMLYVKYIINKDDVNYLKDNDLNLYLHRSSGGLSNLKFNYIIVSQDRIDEFNKVFNEKDSNGEYFNLIFPPIIQQVIFTSSLADNELSEEEYNNNDELMKITLMQSQLYIGNCKIEIVDNSGNVFITRDLNSEEVYRLQRDNLLIILDAANMINTFESHKRTNYFYVKITYDTNQVKSNGAYTIKVI